MAKKKTIGGSSNTPQVKMAHKKTRKTWSEKDLGVIQYCIHKKMGYKRIYTEYGKSHGWKKNSIKHLLARYKKNKSTERKKGQGRKTSGNRLKLEETLKRTMKEDPANQHHSVRKIAARENVPRTTVRRALRTLGFVSRKKVKGQRLGQQKKTKRLALAKKILSQIKRKNGKIKVEDMFFSDEKIFRLRETSGGTQNNRLWVQEDCVKADVPGNLLILNVETNAPGIMVGLCVGVNGVTRPVFVEKGVKINTEVYCETMLKSNYFPEIRAMVGEKWVFQQDGAPAHRSNATKAYLQSNTPAYLKQWPPNSPDLNPLDYSIWSIIATHVNRQGPENYNELRAAVVRAVTALGRNVVAKACMQFKERLEMCVQMEGGHFEYRLPKK